MHSLNHMILANSHVGTQNIVPTVNYYNDGLGHNQVHLPSWQP